MIKTVHYLLLTLLTFPSLAQHKANFKAAEKFKSSNIKKC